MKNSKEYKREERYKIMKEYFMCSSDTALLSGVSPYFDPRYNIVRVPKDRFLYFI
jgi:hypothetical protein